MPLYEYECEACTQRFEVIQKYSDPSPEVCAKCGKGPVRRLMSSPAIQFKGSGFYITDYPKKGNAEATAAGKPGSGSSSSDSGTKSDTASKPEGTSKSEGGAKSDSPSKSDTSSSSTSASSSSSTKKE